MINPEHISIYEHDDYVLMILDHLQNFSLDDEMACLPPWRRDAVMAIHHEQGKRQSVAAYRLLMMLLERHCGISGHVAMAYHDGGKPYLPHHPNIHFNMSHCRCAVACVVAKRNVGVDIESIRRFNDSLARHVLSDDEYLMVTASPSPQREFIRLWTMKESKLKMTGTGLRTDIKTVLYNDESIYDTIINDNYFVTVCLDNS